VTRGSPVSKKVKGNKARSKAKSAVMQPRYRSKTEPAAKGSKSYSRKEKHIKPTDQQEEQ